MGRSTTPKFAIEMDCTGVVTTPQAWHVKPPVGCKTGYGKPTAENLAKYVETYLGTLKPGGVNRHLVTAFGSKVIPHAVRVVKNDGSREVVAEWKAPMFMALDGIM